MSFFVWLLLLWFLTCNFPGPGEPPVGSTAVCMEVPVCMEEHDHKKLKNPLLKIPLDKLLMELL